MTTPLAPPPRLTCVMDDLCPMLSRVIPISLRLVYMRASSPSLRALVASSRTERDGKYLETKRSPVLTC